MVILKVKTLVFDLYTAIIGTVTDEEMFKENLAKIFSKDELYVIVNELNKEPYKVNLFVPFKQLIVRVQLTKIVGENRIMIFYNCKNDLSIAENICNGFEEWDEITKENFLNTFYAVLANYDPDDLAELQVVA